MSGAAVRGKGKGGPGARPPRALAPRGAGRGREAGSGAPREPAKFY